MALTVLSIALAILVFCLLLTIVSMLYLFSFNIKRTNSFFSHPYLRVLPWERLSFANKTAVIMDYFFRLTMPKAKHGLLGHANQQLSHIDPKQVPLAIRWPILGMWYGCWVGILAMLIIWGLVLFANLQN